MLLFIGENDCSRTVYRNFNIQSEKTILNFPVHRYFPIKSIIGSRNIFQIPKNNSGRDVMMDAPGYLEQSQLDELNLVIDIKE